MYRKMKRKQQQQLTAALVNERYAEEQRSLLEQGVQDAQKLRDMLRIHNEARHRFRTYLRTVQYDNEIVIIQKMKSEGVLW